MKDLLKLNLKENTNISELTGKQTIASLTECVNILIEKINTLENSNTSRDRGPKSKHSMTEKDAYSIMLGDLKNKSHKECANILGLSYGQVYSARNGYTFRKVYAKMKK